MNRKRCDVCRLLTEKWQRIGGGAWHCYDGCHSSTGKDRRTVDGLPAWLKINGKEPFDRSRMIPGVPR